MCSVVTRSSDEAPMVELTCSRKPTCAILVVGAKLGTVFGQLKGPDDSGIKTGSTPTFITLLTPFVLTLTAVIATTVGPGTLPTPVIGPSGAPVQPILGTRAPITLLVVIALTTPGTLRTTLTLTLRTTLTRWLRSHLLHT